MMYFETLKTIRSFQFHLSFSSNVPLLHVMFQNCLVVFFSHGYDNNFWGFDMAALHQYRKLDPNSIARGGSVYTGVCLKTRNGVYSLSSSAEDDATADDNDAEAAAASRLVAEVVDECAEGPLPVNFL